MSLPHNLYKKYRAINNCALIKDRVATEESLDEFAALLNEALPTTDNQEAFYGAFRSMYMLNPDGMYKYVRDWNNNVAPLILWTDSKSISRYFKLFGLAHVRYTKDADSLSGYYEVHPYKEK
jgi:hypothetical protein